MELPSRWLAEMTEMQERRRREKTVLPPMTTAGRAASARGWHEERERAAG